MYADANDIPKIKKEQRKMAKEWGMKPEPPKAVDLEYGFVPTSVSQSAKGSSSNVRKTAEMNNKRFGYKED